MATVGGGLWHFYNSAATNDDDLGTLCVCVCVAQNRKVAVHLMFGKPIAHKKMISALELLPQLDPKIEYTQMTAHSLSHVCVCV